MSLETHHDISALSYEATHEVINQAPPLTGYNAFAQDMVLVEGLRREGALWAEKQLTEFGAFVSSEEAAQWATEANTYTPVLHTHDRFGHRIDEVTFHPSWHQLMRTSLAEGAHALSWRGRQPATHVVRSMVFYLSSQMEAGHCCPVSMTHAVIPVLHNYPDLAQLWEPLLTSLTYDAGLRPAQEKQGILCGMGMTEKQGGSDVRANTTRAMPTGDGHSYLLSGHKWFCSAPMCDIFLVLAQAPKGLTCFLLPRVLPDGSRNRFFIQRLKDKLGNRSNASSEVEFAQTWAIRVGEEGRGVRTIIEMVNHTRLDCVIGSAATMRQSLVYALHHAAHRKAFGKLLLHQPLMQNVLADLTIESESATLTALRLAHACDYARSDAHEAAIKRIGTAVAKYWITKRCPMYVAEALECLGGNGYVEEHTLPRLYREAPLNSIWEGAGNVNCLDVLRAMAKEPETIEVYFAEIGRAKGLDANFDRAFLALQRELADLTAIEMRARRIVEQMALLLQGALLLQYGNTVAAEAFCVSRLGGDWGNVFGTLSSGTPVMEIIRHAMPQIG